MYIYVLVFFYLIVVVGEIRAVHFYSKLLFILTRSKKILMKMLKKTTCSVSCSGDGLIELSYLY